MYISAPMDVSNSVGMCLHASARVSGCLDTCVYVHKMCNYHPCTTLQSRTAGRIEGSIHQFDGVTNAKQHHARRRWFRQHRPSTNS